jgi:Universal stress protein family
MATNLGSACVIALIDEEGEFDHVLRAGARLARERGAPLVLYDASSASSLSEPVSSPVSAEGVGEQFGSFLEPEDLERLGRPEMAARVRRLRDEGVDAWGRLASEHGVEPLMRFARDRGAALVVLPAEMDDPGLVDRLRGETLENARTEASVPVAVVDGRSGVVELIRPQADEPGSAERTG